MTLLTLFLSLLAILPQDDNAFRTPVLLVPGWGDNAEDLERLRGRFVEAGWAADRISAVSFEDPVGSNRDHAEEIAAAVEQLQTQAGAAKVDIVAHSMGGLATRYYLAAKEGSVRRVAFLGTPQEGTFLARFAWGSGAEEMVPGSDLLDFLETTDLPEGVESLTIRTPLDLRVLPQESAELDGATNLVVCCPTHAGLLRDPEIFDHLLSFLQDDFSP